MSALGYDPRAALYGGRLDAAEALALIKAARAG